MIVEILIFFMEKVCVFFRTSESFCGSWRHGCLSSPQEIHMEASFLEDLVPPSKLVCHIPLQLITSKTPCSVGPVTRGPFFRRPCFVCFCFCLFCFVFCLFLSFFQGLASKLFSYTRDWGIPTFEGHLAGGGTHMSGIIRVCAAQALPPLQRPALSVSSYALRFPFFEKNKQTNKQNNNNNNNNKTFLDPFLSNFGKLSAPNTLFLAKTKHLFFKGTNLFFR